MTLFATKPDYEFLEHAVLHNPKPETEWDSVLFSKKFKLIIQPYKPSDEEIEFDMINLDSSFANAIRRILIAEVSSVAIERIYLTQNTSVMADEMISHRLGLIPLNVNPQKLKFPDKALPDSEKIELFDPAQHLIFDLNVKFTKEERNAKAAAAKKEAPSGEDAVSSVLSKSMYSSDLKWVPLPGQKDAFGVNNLDTDIADSDTNLVVAPAPVSPHILLNKITSGEEVVARCLAVKGIGRDHAKFSPVSAAFYKFHPRIRLLRTIEGEEANKLKASFVPGVIEVDPRTHKARVVNERLDNGSREFYRHEEFREPGVLEVGIDENHCLFRVETVAPCYRPPDSLVRSSFTIMLAKCAHYLAIVNRPSFCDHTNTTNESQNKSTKDLIVTSRPSVSKIVDAADELQKKQAKASKAVKPDSESEPEASTRMPLNGREVGLEVTHLSTDGLTATFSFFGEDHTLGAALRFCILRSKSVNLCGYCVPHPLEDMIRFEIQSKKLPAVQVLRAGLLCLQECFVHIKNTFKREIAIVKAANNEVEMGEPNEDS